MIEAQKIQMRQLKYIASIEMGQSPPSTEYSLQPDSGFPFLQGTADFGATYPEPKVYCATPTKVAKSDDILFSVRAPVGEINIADQLYGIGRGLCAVTCSDQLDQRFAWWALHWARTQLAFVATGSTYEAVAVSDVSNIVLPFFPLTTQRAIATYLDRETAKIDAMIDAKQRLLALLAEKRRALITHAVTRGLDPTVPMRDSGVPWIGEVPAHWEMVVSGNLIDHIEQGWSPVAEERKLEQGGWGVIKLNAVKNGEFYEDEHKVLPSSYTIPQELQLSGGDFLVTRANTPLLVGDVCIVGKIGHKLILSDLVYRLHLRLHLIDPYFLKYVLLSQAGRIQIEMQARGSSLSMVKISQDHVRGWIIPLPPLAEQHLLVERLHRNIDRIDNLVTIAQQSITFLQERRVALIAAAVTGQITVVS